VSERNLSEEARALEERVDALIRRAPEIKAEYFAGGALNLLFDLSTALADFSNALVPPPDLPLDALAEIETLAFRQYLDWMHFHELAMSKPFEAEDEAQDFARRVSSLATIALGEHSTIKTVDLPPPDLPAHVDEGER
jgi:hypothetical protein